MKTRGWNGEWLEVGFSKAEAVALRDLLGYLVGHPKYPYRARDGVTPQTPSVSDEGVLRPGHPGPDSPLHDPEQDELVLSMVDTLYRVVHARTKA